MTIGVFVLVAATAFASDTGTKDSYVFRDGGITWMIGQGMSSEALQRIQSQYGDSFLWARRNGQILVTHERFVLDAARIVVARRDTGDEREARFAEITDAAMHRGSRARGSYVLAADTTRVTISQGMSIKNVKFLRDKYNDRFLWVRTKDGTWLIDDPDYLARATAFFADELALGPEQRAVADEESQLDREEERLEDRHDSAAEKRLEEIRSRQREVSRREQALDQREEAIEKVAEEKLWALIDDAIRRGVARRTR
ncbi:MAG: hypothetical protein M3041_18870 [Acidobacteriota bacterium]|nr:hypothetical protein [Acidobacteriota bacterium]